MVIGIDASRAFQKNKTGIEEYSYQVIKHLRDFLKNENVILYCNPAINEIEYPDPVKFRDARSRRSVIINGVNFELPKSWKIKNLRAPIFWTQARLSLEMLLHPIDVLFIPAHTVPLIHPARNASRFQKIIVWFFSSLYLLDRKAVEAHSDAGGPKNTMVTIHGLEYEFCPKAYSSWQRFYMRFVIKNSCRWARKIIAVSENTKRDLMKLYEVPEKKIEVIYEGISNFEFRISNQNLISKLENSNIYSKFKIQNSKFLLFVGRLEERKNICGIIEAFEILKNKYNIPHKLVLAGKFGYGKDNIENKIENCKYKEDIILPGYVIEEEKFELMKKAEVFLFPTFYEGFGLPILEAQGIGVPVITSNVSSMPEVAGNGAVLVDPKDANTIAEVAYKLISDESYKNDIIEKGYDNIKRFSWEKCAGEIAEIILAEKKIPTNRG